MGILTVVLWILVIIVGLLIHLMSKGESTDRSLDLERALMEIEQNGGEK